MRDKKQLRNLLLSTISRPATAALAIAVLLGLTAVLTRSARAQTFAGQGDLPEKVLHNFGNGTDGVYPSGLAFDSAGNLYGTTDLGGIHGEGTVFELTPTAGGSWTENLLHNFGGTDGAGPSGVIFDAAGNLYGTTQAGWDSYLGTVFKLTPTADGSWTENVLYNFNGDGYDPLAGLVFDAAGNLYGRKL